MCMYVAYVCVCVYVCMCVLQEVNYSHNEIEEIADLSPHHSLRTLILDGTHTHTPLSLCIRMHVRKNVNYKTKMFKDEILYMYSS